MEDRILLAHGSGGELTHRLLNELILPAFSNPILDKMEDAAIIRLNGKSAFTTDSFVVNPLFFPGGDIGKLAVCGTVNDLAVMGAKPLYMTASCIVAASRVWTTPPRSSLILFLASPISTRHLTLFLTISLTSE